MAEGLLALSVGANVVQFIDFSTKILSASHHLYDSGSNATRKNQELDCVTHDLQKVTSDLHSTFQKSEARQSLSANDLLLQQLTVQCEAVCSELSEALERLKSQGKRPGWKSFRTALKSIWSEKKIEDLRERIELFRQELILRILFSLR